MDEDVVEDLVLSSDEDDGAFSDLYADEDENNKPEKPIKDENKKQNPSKTNMPKNKKSRAKKSRKRKRATSN